jgi:hypothetical protein
MLGEESGRFIRQVDTPGGGYRIVETSNKNSKLVRVSYFDKNGVEQKDLVEWRRYSIWQRVRDWILGVARWFSERL